MGVKKPVIKGHGSSDAKAAFSAIIQAKKFVETNVIQNIEGHIGSMEVIKDE